MIYIKPSFYKDFKCISSLCSDNCCIGWEIDIDESTLQKYKKVKGAFGERLMNNIEKTEEGDFCFKLKEGERCPFLNSKNLCDIIINCGEDHLSDICNMHPRFFQWLPGVTECGLGLSCEEVCRLLLEGNFFNLEVEGEKEPQSEEDKELLTAYNEVFNLRNDLFNILKEENKSYCQVKAEAIKYIEKRIGDKLYLRSDRELIAIYKKTEPIDEGFTLYINELDENSEEIPKIQNQDDEHYKRTLAYIIYRHLVKGIYDFSTLDRIYFAFESVRFIELMDKNTLRKNGKLTDRDKINNIKYWSKQIEYSSLNTELLIYGEE